MNMESMEKTKTRERETTEDFFNRILQAVQTDERTRELVGRLDYAVAFRLAEYITNDEFDLLTVPVLGGSEGWYLEVYLYGSWNQKESDKTQKLYIGVCKTLEEGLAGALLMGQLSGAFLYFGRKIIVENEEMYAADVAEEEMKGELI